MNYNNLLVPQLRQLLVSIGQPSAGVKEYLVKRLRKFGPIPEKPFLGHLDTYHDWTVGGDWIKVMLHRVIDECAPEFSYDTDIDGCTCYTDGDFCCRCQRLINIRINEVEYPNWSYDLVKNCLSRLMASDDDSPTGVSDIGKYILFRTLSLLVRDCVKDGYTEKLVEGDVTGGYYGQELITRCYIRYHMYESLKNGITLKQLLKWEYGHDLNENITFVNVIEINPKDIIIPNKGHFQKCLTEDIYQWYHGIVGICSENNGKYTLKDGYHRLASAYQRESVKIIVAIFE